MSILVNKETRVLVQGITGGAGSFHTKRMLDFGTGIVGGTSPGKGGQEVHGLPVFDTVAEAVEKTGADASVVFLPAQFVQDAAIEAIHAGLKLVVVIPEHIPIHDMLRVREEAMKHGTRVIGGNTAGIISPGEANLGIIPDIAFKKGRVGTVSRSGSITYYVADTLTSSGYGETTCVGLGGDPILGSTFDEILALFDQDDETEAVVMVGEIGGVYEERAAEQVSKMSKPVVVMIGGVFAPPGKRMGHAGAIVEGEMGTAKHKLDVLQEAGAHWAKTFLDIPRILEEQGV
ncbi:succinate--CoA ligase subunit alpha [Candidatus Zixiibacteriota bacterium]